MHQPFPEDNTDDNAKLNLGFLFTGGTISYRQQPEAAFDEIVDIIQLMVSKTNFVVKPHLLFNILSENLNIEGFARIVQRTSEMIELGCNHILITHGTDTMHYTAHILHTIFGGMGVRICLTGAIHSLQSLASDGQANVEQAVRFITHEECQPGVYVSFADGQCGYSLHHATQLNAMRFDEPAFTSQYGKVAAHTDILGEIIWSDKVITGLPSIYGKVPLIKDFVSSAKKLMIITPHPGFSLDNVHINESIDTIIIDSFHSGTAPIDLIETLRHRYPYTIIAISGYPADHLTTPYESTIMAIDHGCLVFANTSAYQIYTHLMCVLATDISIQNYENLVTSKNLKTLYN